MAEDSMAVWEALRAGQDRRGSGDVLREAVSRFVHAPWAADVQARIGAERYERSDERTAQRNGVRQRAWETRVGTRDPRIPKPRAGTSNRPVTAYPGSAGPPVLPRRVQSQHGFPAQGLFLPALRRLDPDLAPTVRARLTERPAFSILQLSKET